MSSDQPMSVIVEFQIRKESGTMRSWVAEWDKRAADAREAEPETAAYAAAIPLDDDSQVLIFERYDRGQSSLDIHMKRPAHAKLGEVMGERKSTKRRVMSSLFTDVPDYGWWGRPETRDAAGPCVLTVVGMRFEDEAKRDTFVTLSAQHAAYCWENEPDTIIYSAGIAQKDSDRGPDIKQGDLIFVTGCTDMAAVEKHRDDPNHIALGDRFTEAGVVMNITFKRQYQTTGNGFLWRG